MVLWIAVQLIRERTKQAVSIPVRLGRIQPHLPQLHTQIMVILLGLQRRRARARRRVARVDTTCAGALRCVRAITSRLPTQQGSGAAC